MSEERDHNREQWIKYTGEGLASAAMGAAIGTMHVFKSGDNVNADTLNLLDAARDYALKVYCGGIDPRTPRVVTPCIDNGDVLRAKTEQLIAESEAQSKERVEKGGDL